MKPAEPVWHILDANDKVLGRLATEAATLLRGKQKPEFVPYLNHGDHVVVINAKKIVLTGNKWEQKDYHHYSGFMGGMRTVLAKTLRETNPEKIVEMAIKGMLPKNKLQNEWMKRLHVYAGSEHPHKANVASAK